MEFSMTPDITILIPAYNVAPYLGKTLHSALVQQGVDHEIVVVEDGSTDGTAAVIDAFRNEQRIHVIRQANTGPSGARNTGLAIARGRYVGFLDGDDLWEPEKAARHVQVMDADPSLDMTYSWWRIIDDKGQPTGRENRTKKSELPAGLGFEGLLIQNFTGTSSTVVCRRDALAAVGGFDDALRANVDLDLWLRITARRPNAIGLVPEVLTSYRMHGNQITSDWRRMEGNWEKVIEKARRMAPDRVARVESLARAQLSRYLAYLAYESGDHTAARRLIVAAWTKAPTALISDRRSWLTTAAIGTTFLPPAWHDGLASAARRWRARTLSKRPESAH